MFQIPRGTRDFKPAEMIKRRYVEEEMRKTFNSFGYHEIQTPTFETLELFTAKSGESILDEIYSFKDKGGRDLALRPELTAPVIRFYVDSMQMEPKPLKLFYIGNCYRYDRPQKGRYREFTQAGCEIIGTDSAEILSELIAMAYKAIDNVGLKKINLKIGNLKILQAIFEKLKITKDQQKYIMPLIDKALYEELLNALLDLGIDSKKANTFIKILNTSKMNEIRDFIQNDSSLSEELVKLDNIMDYLKDIFEIKNFSLDMSIVRGLDYYTGTVFEIESPQLGAEKQICGGGVYELIETFGGRKTPQAGFAIGFDRVLLALETENYKFPQLKIKAYVIPITPETLKNSLEITQNLRKKGIVTDIDIQLRGMSKALKYASSINAEKTILIGPRELEQNIVIIRDMQTGKQENVEIKNLIKYFK
jgi:histidyl-tRNA synthetase